MSEELHKSRLRLILEGKDPFTPEDHARMAKEQQLEDEQAAVDGAARQRAFDERGGYARVALSDAGVPRRILEAVFVPGRAEPFGPQTPRESVLTAQQIAAGASVYIFGNAGSGKSHVAACGMLGLYRGATKQVSLMWCEWRLVLQGLREEISDEHREHSIMGQMENAGLLVLDDIGPTARPTPFAVDSMAEIITRRYNDMKQTVVTSNYPPDGLAAVMKSKDVDAMVLEPMVSRLAGGMSSIIKLQGRDRRTDGK